MRNSSSNCAYEQDLNQSLFDLLELHNETMDLAAKCDHLKGEAYHVPL